MTLPRAALRVWAEAIASPRLIRTGATRHMVPFDVSVDLDDFADCEWSDAGFTLAKLRYLRKRYPIHRLPSDGCIARAQAPTAIVYRRVDVTRGWLADALYLRSLGWRGPCRFSCPSVGGLTNATLHAVPASAVAPAVHAAGLWLGAAPPIARTLRRAIVHRLERRHESRAATRRVNEWAHRIASTDSMRAVVAALDEQTGRTEETTT